MEKEKFVFPDFEWENIIEYWDCSFQEVYNQNRNLAETKLLWFVWAVEGKPFVTNLQKFKVTDNGLTQIINLEMSTDKYMFLKSLWIHDLAEITNPKIELLKKSVKSMLADRHTHYTFEEFDFIYQEYCKELEKEL